MKGSVVKRFFVGPVIIGMLLTIACSGSSSSSDESSSSATTEQANTVATQSTPPPVPTATPGPLQWKIEPPLRIDTAKDYKAVFTLKNLGNFTVDLYEQRAPKAVNSFVFLAREGYYDGSTFHRVIEGFMAQGGDPSGTGKGGPGYQFDNQFHPELRHYGPGYLAQANAGIDQATGKGTNGSQFYFTYSEQHRLDGLNTDGTPKPCEQQGVSCHMVFGKVEDGGMDIVNAIAERDPNTTRSKGTEITSIQITEQ